ncbi:unnamed protein product [Caenorhabditis nigoni]
MRPPCRDEECEKAIRFISKGIKNYKKPENLPKWCELAKTKVGYDKSAESFSQVINKRLDKIEDLQGFTFMEKVKLVFIFSRSVSPGFLKIMREEKCVVELSDWQRISYFRSPDGTCVLHSDHNNLEKYFKGKPYFHKRRTAGIQVRSSDNARDRPDITSNNHNHEIKVSEKKKEENRNAFDGRIDYDYMDNGEYPEFMVPDDDEPSNNKRHQEPFQGNPKRLKIEKLKEPEVANREDEEYPEQNSDDSDDPSSRINNESDIQNEVAPVGDQSIDKNHVQNLVQITQKRVKIEEFLEEIEQEPEVWIPEEKPEMPPPTISLLKLTEQIETFAFNIYLDEKFQRKTLRAVRMFKANDQTIPIQEFNIFFTSMLAGLKRERNQNSNKNSIQLVRLFKQLQRNFIRPLGEEIMAEALGILDEEIEKLGDSEDEIPLKSVQIKIDGLMSLITSSWANLDE